MAASSISIGSTISYSFTSTVPIAAEVLKKKCVYDRSQEAVWCGCCEGEHFCFSEKNLKLIDVDVSVIGGHAGITILPILTKTKPSISFEIQELTEVVDAKAGAGSATLSMAYAAARFVDSCLGCKIKECIQLEDFETCH